MATRPIFSYFTNQINEKKRRILCWVGHLGNLITMPAALCFYTTPAGSTSDGRAINHHSHSKYVLESACWLTSSTALSALIIRFHALAELHLFCSELCFTFLTLKAFHLKRSVLWRHSYRKYLVKPLPCQLIQVWDLYVSTVCNN